MLQLQSGSIFCPRHLVTRLNFWDCIRDTEIILRVASLSPNRRSKPWSTLARYFEALR